MKKILLYSVGDPAGIGADIILQTVTQEKLDDIVVAACLKNLQSRANLLDLSIEFLDEDASITRKGQLRVKDVPLDFQVKAGSPNPHTAKQVLKLLDIAIQGCLDTTYAAMVTGPLNKAVINDAGIPFSGHTEYLAEKTDKSLPVMMLATDDLRVALLTTHLPLKEVPQIIDKALIENICRIVNTDLISKYGLKKPRILLCGLNPHAGENGYLGREEIEVFEPALRQLKNEGIDIIGPLPADTLFQPRYLNDADVVIACYHDQGLPVLKFHGFGRAANITLGLPIIRTSVDHGTAYDLAGTGKADIGSLMTALEQARAMADNNGR